MKLPSTSRTAPRPPTMNRSLLSALAAVAMLFGGAAHAALQNRDLDGNGVTDAFYDTVLDITWLRDANVNGGGGWATAVAWADNYSIGGYSDWRLPTCNTCSIDPDALGETGHLWSSDLGNPAGGPMTNTGNFQNLEATSYWLANEASPTGAWVFVTSQGFSGVLNKLNTYPLAMAVRDGDVLAVPEPETYALMLAGLAGVAFAAKRRPHRD